MIAPTSSSSPLLVRLRKVQQTIANTLIEQRTVVVRLAGLRLRLDELRASETALLRALGHGPDTAAPGTEPGRPDGDD